jgi:hypothetical protein
MRISVLGLDRIEGKSEAKAGGETGQLKAAAQVHEGVDCRLFLTARPLESYNYYNRMKRFARARIGSGRYLPWK